MTALDEERLSELRQLVPPVLSPPINDVYRRVARIRRKRNAYRATGLIGVVAAGALAVMFGGSALRGHTSPTAAGHPALSCETGVQTSPLPTWARGGFTPPDQSIAHVTGSGGDIVGVFFGDLHAPALPDQGNEDPVGGPGGRRLRVPGPQDPRHSERIQRCRRPGGDRRPRSLDRRCAARGLLDLHAVLVRPPGGGRRPLLVTAKPRLARCPGEPDEPGRGGQGVAVFVTVRSSGPTRPLADTGTGVTAVPYDLTRAMQ